MSYDVADILAANPIETVIAARTTINKNGKEWAGLCPFHNEKTSSFTVNTDKGFYHCFGCGAHGDTIDFVQEFHAVDFKAACGILGGQKSPASKNREKRAARIVEDVYAGIEPLLDATPPPINGHVKAWNPKRGRWSDYQPVAAYRYTPAIYVLRIEFGDGKKITPQIVWCKWDNNERWCHFPFPHPLPLYGSLSDGKPVLIVEGEKCRDAAQAVMGASYDCITWPGGTGAADKADWSGLKDKAVLIWGDADEPGEKAVTELVGILDRVGAKQIKILPWDKDKAKGWDVADAISDGWGRPQIIKWAKERVELVIPRPVKALETPPPDDLPPIEHYEETPPPPTAPDADGAPFRCLGHNRGTYYFFPYKTQQVVALQAMQLKKHNLWQLAGDDYWEELFPNKTGVNWDAVAQSLINQSCRVGYFRGSDTIRGRGAWIDEGRAVLHLGTTVYLDGKPYEPKNAPSKYCYEGGVTLDIDTTTAATSKEAHSLVDICDSLSWENPLSGAMLAGWCVVAPVCGMLTWRPHVWLTGASGSGKSTVVNNICHPFMGKIVKKIEGSVTEASIRQMLQQDALPVIYDEADCSTKQDQMRMKSVLMLARTASSGGTVPRGTKDGEGVSYTMRSCFMFTSIHTSLEAFADENRFTKLVLKEDVRADKTEHYEKLKIRMFKTFTPEYSSKMLARSIQNLSTLQKNCDTFIKAAAVVCRSSRIADQIGTMLAGFYLCFSTKEVTLEKAMQWIEKQHWGDHTTMYDKKDEERLLDRIATSSIRVDTQAGVRQSTVGELILIWWRGHSVDSGGIEPEDAQRHLRRVGIRVEDDTIWIANKCEPLSMLLRDTPWTTDWARPLREIYKAVPSEKTMRFNPRVVSRATGLPIELFREG